MYPTIEFNYLITEYLNCLSMNSETLICKLNITKLVVSLALLIF